MNKRSYLLLGVAAVAIIAVTMRVGDRHVPVVQNSKLTQEIKAAEAVTSTRAFTPVPTMAGNYLAARFAVSNDDLVTASKFYGLAIENAKAPADQDFLFERTLPASLGAGDMKTSLEIARKMDLKKPTATAQLAVLAQIIEEFKLDDAEKIKTLLPDLRSDGFGRLLKPLLEAWSFASEKNYTSAEATLARLKQEYPSLQPLVQMHMAFLYDLQDRKKEAELLYSQSLHDNLSIRSAYIIAQFYERQGKKAEVEKLYQTLAQKMPGASLPHIVLERLKSGNLDKEAFINKPRDGVAAALYDVATVLHQEGSSRLAVLYAQMAHYLSPKDEFTSLLLGDILAVTEENEQAAEFLNKIPKTSDLYVLAQMRLVQIYEQEESFDKAIVILENFSKDPLVKQQAVTELADLYRRKEDFAKAIPYYSEAIAAKTTLVAADWVLFYSRGIAYEQSGDWAKAEEDLAKALELSPQQPEVLNYLAYSWADHGKNLPQALEMLQKALAGAPDDPYITDSVGWAFYRNGQYEEAVPYLEAAVQQLPEDPVINDHLGDIYWRVGRELEAQFQWERALKNSKETDKKLRTALEVKLKKGLSDEKKVISEK